MTGTSIRALQAGFLALLLSAQVACDQAGKPVADPILAGRRIDLLRHPWRTQAALGDTATTSWALSNARAVGLQEFDQGQIRRALALDPDQGYWTIPLPKAAQGSVESLNVRVRSAGEGLWQIGLTAPGQPTAITSLAAVAQPGEWLNLAADLGRDVVWTHPIESIEVFPPTGEAGEVALASTRVTTNASARARTVEVDARTRRVLEVRAGVSAVWRVELPSGARLSFGTGVPRQSAFMALDVDDGHGTPTRAWQRYVVAGPSGPWRTASVDLSAWSGQTVDLRFAVEAQPPRTAPFESRIEPSDQVAWFGAPRIDGVEPPAPNVVVLVVDTLRRDALGRYRRDRATSPHLDEFFRRCTVFERAFATAPWTHPSTGSLLTGLLPADHGLGTATLGLSRFRPGIRLIAERFKDAGYRTGAVSNNLIVSPDEGFARGFDCFDTRTFDVPQVYGARRVTTYAREWLNEGDAPFFLYVHYFDPHDRYQAPPPHTHRFVDTDPAVESTILAGRVNPTRKRMFDDGVRTDFTPDQRDMDHLRGLYDGEVAYTDLWIARLIDSLPLENTVVVVTSDHGEEFLDHGYLKHGQGLYNELIHVPLAMYLPDRSKPRTVVSPVSLIDVAPTVLGAVGLDHGDLPGRNLLQPIDDERPVLAVSYGSEGSGGFAGHGPKQAVILGGFKLIRTLDPVPGTTGLELFALSDSLEVQDLSDLQPDRVARLVAIADSALVTTTTPATTATRLSPAAQEKLKALGYAN